MPVKPIEARCRRCNTDFHLFELLDYRTGTCPRCGRSLSPDWTAQLLADAARADAAQRHLIGALRNLRNLPGNVALRPNVVLRNLFEEVGWQKDLAEDPAMLREELRELRWLLTAWELLDPSFSAAQPRRNWFLRRLDRLTGQHLPPPVMPINDATAAPREEPATPDTPEKEEERCSPVLAS